MPDMFRQMTERLWKEFSKARPSIDVRMPEKVLVDCKELVLVDGKLEEIARLPGENDVSTAVSLSPHPLSLSYYHSISTKIFCKTYFLQCSAA